MKFCYVDETGTDGKANAVVLVGIIADKSSLNKTEREWQKLKSEIEDSAGISFAELKGRDLIPGNSAWRKVHGDLRAQIICNILSWCRDRKLRVTFSAIDIAKFNAVGDGNDLRRDLEEPWIAAAFHVLLTLQRAHQRIKRGKGHTWLIFDENKYHMRLARLVQRPPLWAGAYFERPQNASLDQIQGRPSDDNSLYSPLIQVADLICYILSRYTAMNDFGSTEEYAGELERYTIWIETIRERCIRRSHRYKSRRVCETSIFFNDLAPPSLQKI